MSTTIWDVSKINEGNAKYMLELIERLERESFPKEERDEIVKCLMNTNLKKNYSIMSRLDDLLMGFYKTRLHLLFEMLCACFCVNHERKEGEFWRCFDGTCEYLKANEQVILEDWGTYLKRADAKYLFALLCIQRIISIPSIVNYIEKHQWKDDLIILFLQGCSLFLVQNEVLGELAFKLFNHISDKERFIGFCKTVLYENYPGQLLKAAQAHLNSDEDTEKKLADALIDNNNYILQQIKEGLGIKEFQEKASLRLASIKIQNKINERINEESNKNSPILRLVQSSTLKYGKRYAFLVNTPTGIQLQVNEYQHISIEKELPKKCMIDPYGYYCDRCQHLKDWRNENAFDS